MTDPVDKAISTYKNHPSIMLIIQKLENIDHFSFKKVHKWNWERMEEAKFQLGDYVLYIPTKILK